MAFQILSSKDGLSFFSALLGLVMHTATISLSFLNCTRLNFKNQRIVERRNFQIYEIRMTSQLSIFKLVRHIVLL